MDEERKEPDSGEEEPIQSPEQSDVEEEFEKKSLTPEEEKEIFGDSEKTEEDKVLEIYRDKEPYEVEFHKKFNLWPNEWIQEEVVSLMKSDHALIRNWKQVNEWIREIVVKLNSGVLIAKMVKEFCPDLCMNPQMIYRGIYGFVDDKKKPIEEQVWTHAVIPCLSCPLFAYGNVDALEYIPDEILNHVKVGRLVKEPEASEDEKEDDKEEEKDIPAGETSSSDLS